MTPLPLIHYKSHRIRSCSIREVHCITINLPEIGKWINFVCRYRIYGRAKFPIKQNYSKQYSPLALWESLPMQSLRKTFAVLLRTMVAQTTWHRTYYRKRSKNLHQKNLTICVKIWTNGKYLKGFPTALMSSYPLRSWRRLNRCRQECKDFKCNSAWNINWFLY